MNNESRVMTATNEAAHMRETGAIALVSGYPARKCRPGMLAISTVGGAVEAFARGAAQELAPIRLNVVSPGTIDTRCLPSRATREENF